MRARALLAAALVLAPALRVAAADPVPSLDLRGFHAPADPSSGVTTLPADAPDTGEWNLGLWTSYAYRPIVLRSEKTDAVVFDVLKHQVMSDLVGGVGLWRRVYLGFDLPVALYQRGASRTAASARAIGPYKFPSQAFGDLGLEAKLTVIRPTGGDLGGFALALDERFTLPSGDPASFLGEGAVTSASRLLVEYRISAFGVHGAFGVKLRTHTESFACQAIEQDACTTRFGHELPFGLGVSLRPQALGIDEKGRVTLFVEMNGHLPASPIAPLKSTAASSLQLGAAARVRVGGDVSILAGLQTALIGGVGDAPVRALLEVSWAPRDHDKDGDGVPDDIDQCPQLAEDLDGFQDHDGCPELDNDDDGIPDRIDRCPNTKEDMDGYQDDDGCPEPDNDLDGILDGEDACPNEAGPRDPDPKKNGCPARQPGEVPTP